MTDTAQTDLAETEETDAPAEHTDSPAEPEVETPSRETEESAEDLPEGEYPEEGGTTPGEEPQAGPAGIVLNRLSLLVGLVTFVVLLSAIAGAFIFVVRKPAAEPAKPVAPAPPPKEKAGNAIYHTLIERYTFSTSLPPLADRSVAFEYSVAVQIDEADRERLDNLLQQQQLMLKLQADIRRIISQEEYTKLRTDDLKDVSRRIRDKLNDELGEKIVQEVVFPIWNVYW